MTTVDTSSSSSVLNNYIASQASSASSTSSSSSTSLYGDYQTFLKILVTQLQNQDPTSPTDVSEFTSQLVQYAEVEQQINSNDKLDKIISSLNSNGITPLLSYVGAYVEAPSEGKLTVQNSQAILAYNLDQEALSAKIYVKNSSGKVIATLNGATTKGLNRLVWDGTCDDGTKAADGAYSFSITAKNSSGETMELSDVRVIGRVTSIETDSSGNVVLKAGDLSFDDKKLISVFANIGSSSETT